MTRHRWIIGLVVATVLAGVGVFFAVQGLSRADQYASVASFLLALVTAGFSVLDRARDVRIAHNNENVNMGDHGIIVVNRGNEPPGKKRRRR